MSKQVTVAIVGVGGIVQSEHLKHLAALPVVKIAGYLRNNSGRAEESAKIYGGQLYDTVDQIASDASIDAVYISVPPCAHGHTELKLLEAKKSLLVEKPLGIDLAAVEQIGRAVETSGVVTSVGYHWRYTSALDLLRTRLAKNAPIGGCGFWCGGRPGVWWWRGKADSGGQAVEQTTHIFDLANYLIDSRPVSVYANGRQVGVYQDDPKHTVDDISVAQIVYENGVALSIWSSDVMDGGGQKVGLELFAVNARYEIDGKSLTIRDAAGIASIEHQGNPYQRMTAAFIHAVATGDRSKIRSTYSDALITHRVTMAVERSIASGKVEAIG